MTRIPWALQQCYISVKALLCSPTTYFSASVTDRVMPNLQNSGLPDSLSLASLALTTFPTWRREKTAELPTLSPFEPEGQACEHVALTPLGERMSRPGGFISGSATRKRGLRRESAPSPLGEREIGLSMQFRHGPH